MNEHGDPHRVEPVASLSHEHEREYVAWAWAVNGFFSVMSSVLATILPMAVGFRRVFFAALVVYAIGAFAFSRTPDPRFAASKTV